MRTQTPHSIEIEIDIISWAKLPESKGIDLENQPPDPPDLGPLKIFTKNLFVELLKWCIWQPIHHLQWGRETTLRSEPRHRYPFFP